VVVVAVGGGGGNGGGGGVKGCVESETVIGFKSSLSSTAIVSYRPGPVCKSRG
jgi:hypothetical protein